MLQKAHIRKFYTYQKYIPTDKERQNLQANISKCLPIVQYFIKRNNITNPEDIPDAIISYAEAIFGDFSQSKYIDSRLYELQAMKDILKNPSIIDSKLPYIKDIPNNHLVYTADMNRTVERVLVNALDEVKKIEEFAKENDITASTNIDNILITGEDKESIKKAVIFSINLLKQKSEKNKILFILQDQQKECESFIRRNEKTSLQSLHRFFSSLGYLDTYISLYKNTSQNFDFSDLQYDLNTDENTGEIGLEETFSDEFLDTLSIEDLCFLDAFWCNKFAKELNNFISGFTAIHSLDLWQDIIDGKTDFYISTKALDGVIKKYHFLNQLGSETFNLHQENISSTEIKMGTSFSEPLSKDYSDYYIQLHNYINKKYDDFFSYSELINNYFIEDLSFINIFINLKEYTYHKKDAILEPLVRSRLDNNYCKNWGLVRNEVISGEYVDAIDADREKLLLAFDIEGFNMPFRFHMLKDSLTDLTKLADNSYLIPEYQGTEDFARYDAINNKYINIPSNIIMPISKSQKKIIMTNANTEGPNKNFWEHLHFLSNGTLPKHLTETVHKTKKQNITRRLPIYYTNLKTGKRFIKDKNKFIEVDDSNVR